MTYQLVRNSNSVKRTNDDGSICFIPNSNENHDWIAYQAWIANGNTPDPAD